MSKFLVIVAGFWKRILSSESSPCIFARAEYYHFWWGKRGKEGKWLTQHLTATSAVFKALRMGFLWVVQGADQCFSTSPVSRLGASQLCHLRHRCTEGLSSGTTGPERKYAALQTRSVPAAEESLPQFVELPREPCCRVMQEHQLLLELLLTAPLAACQAAELFDTVRHRCFRNGGRIWHVLFSFTCTLSVQSSFILILLQLKQLYLDTGSSSHICLEGKVQYGSVKPQTYFILGWVWTGGKSGETI